MNASDRFDRWRAEAAQLDAEDPLGHLRAEFAIPTHHDGTDEIYLVGNSLGAQPHRARTAVVAELDDWSNDGVRGHFTPPTPWVSYHELLVDAMAGLVGAKANEVTLMNALTVNLHLLLISFYEPTPERHKILIEEHAFPSDHFAVESQIRQRGYDPATSLITVSPRPGSELLDVDDIEAAIAEHGDSLATVLLPGVQYYTGQVLPIRRITAAAHAVGARMGWDLAHAAGNVPLSLHDDGVDFAAWCTYKYLNSGPGGVAGAYVHERHHTDPSLNKLLGWWGTNGATRFEMVNDFDPIPTVDSWHISNGAVLTLAALRGALEVFDLAGGIGPLRAKSRLQLDLMDRMLDAEFSSRVRSITPTPFAERGCQYALEITDPAVDGRAVFEHLEAHGVGCDWRYPNVIRVAPVPLYNSFGDIAEFGVRLDAALTAS